MPAIPRVSVVVPAYNHERFVGEAIDSALAQTLADLEIVVVDDGSTDGTAGVAQARAAGDARVRVVRQPNGGSHSAINRGIAESRAPWIAILNSDDRWAPRRLERLDEETRSGASFVVTGARLIGEDGREIDDPGHWWLATMRDFRARAKELGPVQGLLYGNYTVSTSNFFFGRDFAAAVGPFRPLRFVPDWDWALRAALHAPDGVRFLADEYLLDYRLHGRNAILGENLLGGCEINRIHRALLAHFGAPAPLVSALFRNQRDLRRNWRARALASVERFVREREADVRSLHDQVGPLTALALERLEAIERQGRQLDEQSGQLEQMAARVREAESSFTWRLARRIRHRFGIGWL